MGKKGKVNMPLPGDWLTDEYVSERRRITRLDRDFARKERVVRCRFCGDWTLTAHKKCGTCRGEQ